MVAGQWRTLTCEWDVHTHTGAGARTHNSFRYGLSANFKRMYTQTYADRRRCHVIYACVDLLATSNRVGRFSLRFRPRSALVRPGGDRFSGRSSQRSGRADVDAFDGKSADILTPANRLFADNTRVPPPTDRCVYERGVETGFDYDVVVYRTRTQDVRHPTDDVFVFAGFRKRRKQ